MEVKAKDIRDWMACMTNEGLKPKSIQMKLTAVKSFYHYCIEENKISKNPTQRVKTPQIDDSLPYYLNKRQIALLQELVKDNVRN